jgi:L-fucose isomerase-like protein
MPVLGREGQFLLQEVEIPHEIGQTYSTEGSCMAVAKAGFVCFGEVNTPREVIRGKAERARKLLAEAGMELVVTDPVSDDPAGADVARAVAELGRGEFDLLILCVAGWIPSHAVVSVLTPFKHTPMLLWGLTGWVEDGRLITTADQAGTSALRKPMQDMGISFRYFYEVYDRPVRVDRIIRYARACRAARLLQGARIGQMGYRDMSLYGTMFDGVSLRARVGVEIEFFEMLEMVQRAEKARAEDVKAVVSHMEKDWVFKKPAAPETMRKAAAWYTAVRDKARERGWQAVSLIDVDGMKKLLGFPPAPIFTLLSEDPGICTVPENDSLGAVTQLMVRLLTGQIAAYFEFYEFMEDRVLVGVPDFVPREVVDGRITILPSAFGGFGEGLLNVSTVKTGRVTLCRLTHAGDRYAMHLVTGNAVTPRTWEECGWAPPAPQLPSLEVVLDSPVEQFAQKVLSQHYILAYGDVTTEVTELCRLLGVEMM